MASFFESLKRMVQGKPVFSQSDSQRGWKGTDGEPIIVPPQPGPEAELQPEQQQTVQADYQPPEVTVDEVECHINGTHMECYGMIHNHSQEQVFLDKIHFLNMTHELKHNLQPGERRELLVYRGNALQNTAYNRAELYFRSETNKEYYAARHLVEFQTQSDGSIIVHRLLFEHPVQHTS